MQAAETAVEVGHPEDDGEFDRLCELGRALPAEEVARFACPCLEDPSMLWGSAEFFRWYMADGTKRSRPLDYEELVLVICMRDRCSLADAEREVCLYSRSKREDRKVWATLVSLGYAELAGFFADEEFDEGQWQLPLKTH